MQHKHLYTLLDESFTTVRVVFGVAHLEKPAPVAQAGAQTGSRPWGAGTEAKQEPSYIYKVRKDWGVQVDDAVIVDSPSKGLVIARVTEVHNAPLIDVDAPFEYKWIVQRVDRTAYDAQVAREASFAATMLEVERLKQREQMLNDVRTHLPADSEARRMFDAAISSVTIEHKPAQ